MPGYTGPNSASGDNSALGYGRRGNRIGIRGAGNVAWSWLNSHYYTTAFPATVFTAAQRRRGRGHLQDRHPGEPHESFEHLLVGGAAVSVARLRPHSQCVRRAARDHQDRQRSGRQAQRRHADFLLAEDHRGRAAQPVLQHRWRRLPAYHHAPEHHQLQRPVAGELPVRLRRLHRWRTNIHEILCFKADPATTAASSAGASEKQSAKLETGAQAYFAFYNPTTWTGRVTASGLGLDNFGNVIIAATPNWDAQCALSGIPAASTCPTTGAPGFVPAQAATARSILTNTLTATAPAGASRSAYASLTSTPAGGQQALINAGDVAPLPVCNASTGYATDQRVNYLRGDQTCELNLLGVGRFRSRVGLLGDIIDSSPTWVGPPVSPYAVTWIDRLHTTMTMPEAGTTAQTYAQYITAAQTRMNVVYVGANDGLLHGFRSGFYDATGTFQPTGNDGSEVLGLHARHGVGDDRQQFDHLEHRLPQPPVRAQLLRGRHPGNRRRVLRRRLAHLAVGGLGAGGQAIFALDVTTPSNFSQSAPQASALVKGEWTSTNITCANVSPCKQNLGNTYGTPALRRLHDGKWAAIFGNGIGSTNGDAGIFVMVINPTTAARRSITSAPTGSAASPNGIAFASPADLDGDHITDYVYAGDLQGNIWRFDLTSATESSWALTTGPGVQDPRVVSRSRRRSCWPRGPRPGLAAAADDPLRHGPEDPAHQHDPDHLLHRYPDPVRGMGLEHGQLELAVHGHLRELEHADSAGDPTYQVPASSLAFMNHTLQKANLQGQTVTIDPVTFNRDIASSASVCWAGSSGCTAAPRYGWYIDLPGSQEQVIFSPELVSQALTVNTIVPAPNNPTSCTNQNDTGFTYVFNALTGAAFSQVFLPPSEAANSAVNTDPRYTDTNAIGMQTNATGSSFITGNNAGTKYLVYETNQTSNNNILGGTLGLNLPTNTTGKRVSWIQRR